MSLVLWIRNYECTLTETTVKELSVVHSVLKYFSIRKLFFQFLKNIIITRSSLFSVSGIDMRGALE